MTQILFATGNSRKIHEATITLTPLGVSVIPTKLDFEEIQHSDSTEIIKAKARAAYITAGAARPVVVSDTSWEIPALGGFPSGYMKDVSIWWADTDWLAIMAPHSDKRIFCLEHVAYYDGTTLQHFVERFEGHFVTTARGRIDENESIERVVSLYGGETMAEQLDRGGVASAGEVLGHWQQFGEWYRKQG